MTKDQARSLSLVPDRSQLADGQATLEAGTGPGAETPADRGRRARLASGLPASLMAEHLAVLSGSAIAILSAGSGRTPASSSGDPEGPGPDTNARSRSLAIPSDEASRLSGLAERANRAHGEIRSHGLAILERCRGAGEILIEAKDEIGHGRFRSWIADHCDFGHRVAAIYMEIARRWVEVEGAARSEAHRDAHLTQSWAMKVLGKPRPPRGRSPLPDEASPVERFDPGDEAKVVVDRQPKPASRSLVVVEPALPEPGRTMVQERPEIPVGPAPGDPGRVGPGSVESAVACLPGRDRVDPSPDEQPSGEAVTKLVPRLGDDGLICDEEFLAEITAVFATGMTRFYGELRAAKTDPRRRQRLWRLSRDIRDRVAAILTVENPAKPKMCRRCGGARFDLKGQTCEPCAGLGFDKVWSAAMLEAAETEDHS